MHRVLPGVFETIAKEFLPVKRLIKDDLPTLDRPITANSGYRAGGHCAVLTLLLINSAVLTFTLRAAGNLILPSESSSAISVDSDWTGAVIEVVLVSSVVFQSSSSSSLKRFVP